jgi:D-alanine-D-alanine ligase
MSDSKLRVAFLTGGDSSERAVAWSSARSVFGALCLEKFDVTVFDLAKPDTHAAQGHYDFPAPVQAVSWTELADTLQKFDVALPVLHGGWGEDGTLQSLLEVAGVACVGSPASACAIAMNKQVGKALARDLGVAVAKGVTVQCLAELQESPFDGPCVVKPLGGGSSVGVTLFKNRDGSEMNELQNAVAVALQDGSGALIEQFIDGTEITCAVLGEGVGAQALPVLEIVPQSAGGFYDYEAKYSQGGSLHLHPPRLPQSVVAKAQKHALAIYRALNCRGVARADFIVDENGTPYFLEINVLPGMTEMSLVPDAARVQGLQFPQLLEFLIESAVKK